MEAKVWYSIENTTKPSIEENPDHDFLIIELNDSNSFEHFGYIKNTVEAFNSLIEWEDMWSMEEASLRFKQGDKLYLLRDNKGALGHIWFANFYMYNLFVHPRRKEGFSEKFVKNCISRIDEPEIFCYCDSWNIRAQKFLEKVGFMKINS